jgi:hypothetical protein
LKERRYLSNRVLLYKNGLLYHIWGNKLLYYSWLMNNGCLLLHNDWLMDNSGLLLNNDRSLNSNVVLHQEWLH